MKQRIEQNRPAKRKKKTRQHTDQRTVALMHRPMFFQAQWWKGDGLGLLATGPGT